jgi:hypothetical protein
MIEAGPAGPAPNGQPLVTWQDPPPMKTRLTRLFSAVLVLAALYLVPVNLALNLPATRDYLNGVAPERFAVTWERAWSLYPLRVAVTGLAADGQTPTEQWQVDARRAAASVSLLPLLQGEIRIHDLDLTDVDLRLRPRPGSQADPGHFAGFYPVIRNRDPDSPAEKAPPDESGALALEIADIHVRGEHAFWVSHVRGSLPGELRGSFRMDPHAGRLSLADGALNLAVRSLQIGDRAHVTDAASLSGRVDIPPFKLSETDGLELLRVPELDARIDLPVRNLDFLALLMPPLDSLELGGQGRLRGRLVLSGGEALRGTDLVVEANELAMDLGPYDFSGDGSVEILVDPRDESQADLTVRFDRVRAELEGGGADDSAGPRLLFLGRGLTARLHAAETDPATTSTAQSAEELLSEVDLALSVTIPSMSVPDLSVYNRLLSDKWAVRILGGQGEVAGRFVVEEQSLALDLELRSDEAKVRFKDKQVVTDLALTLHAAGRSDGESATMELTGTALRLDQARVTKGDDREERPWQAALTITGGQLEIPVLGDRADPEPMDYLTRTLTEEGLGRLLADANGRVAATLSVSRLGWIPRLLDAPFGLTLFGRGKIDADLLLEDGWLAEGTTLEVEPQRLELGLLDHRLEGQGQAALALVSGGERPDLRLDVELHDAEVTRSGGERAEIDQLRLQAEVLVTDVTPGGAGKTLVNLRIPSARVPDMGAFTPYLPPDAPVKLLSGEASLTGDLQLRAETARGELLLRAEEVRVGIGEVELTASLTADVLVRDGNPANLRFDLSGSRVLLADVRVAGDTASYARDDWRANFEIETAKLVWTRPMHLELRALTTLKDTRPLLAVLDNARAEHDWLDGLLQAEDLAGRLQLVVDGERALLSEAMLGGAEINVGAKGVADASGLEGLLYVRWHNLTGTLALAGEERHFSLLGARDRFDAYVPGRTSLPGRGPGDAAEIAAEAGETRKPGLPRPPHQADDPTPRSRNLFLDPDL